MQPLTDYQQLIQRVAFDQAKTKIVINGFDKETAPLNVEEVAICNYVVTRLQYNKGKARSATSVKIIKGVRESLGVKFSGPRLRKIINHIRRNDLLRGLIATSKGYYISTDAEEIKDYIASLRQRADAINAVADAMQRDLNQLKIFNPYVRNDQQPERTTGNAGNQPVGPGGSSTTAETGSTGTDGSENAENAVKAP